jgi:uncharacterized protein (DUF1684 family)
MITPRIVIVVYRPLQGKTQQLMSVVRRHLDVLASQHLVTERAPIVMRAKDGCIVEVFEWTSAKAIEDAHTNPVVQGLWREFSEVCTYEKPVSVTEFSNLFSEFEPIHF